MPCRLRVRPIQGRDANGCTPLVLSPENADRHPEVVKTLAEAGANVNAADNNGCSPLFLGLGNLHPPDVILALLKAGADTNAASLEVPLVTPLMSSFGKSASDYARESTMLKGTDTCRQLEAASRQTGKTT